MQSIYSMIERALVSLITLSARRAAGPVRTGAEPDHGPPAGDHLRIGATVPVGAGRTEPVYLDQGRRVKGLWVTGKPGKGKSTLLEHLMLEDFRYGLGHDDRSTVVVCFRGTEVRAAMSIMLSIAPPPAWEGRLVILDFANASHITRWALLPSSPFPHSQALGVTEIFKQHFPDLGVTNQEAIFLGMLAGALSDVPFSICDLLDFIGNAAFRARVTESVTDPAVNSYRLRLDGTDTAPLVSQVGNKLSTGFLAHPTVRLTFGQSGAPSLREILAEPPPKIVLVSLAADRLHEGVARLAGSLVVNSCQEALMGGAPPGNPRRLHIYLDECQLLASSSWSQLISEGRKFGAGLTLANQALHGGQLSKDLRDLLMNNIGTRIHMGTGYDAKTLAPFIGTGAPLADVQADLQRLDVGEAFMVTEGQDPCRVRLDFKPVPPADPNKVAELVAGAYRAFGRPAADVEREHTERREWIASLAAPGGTPPVRSRVSRSKAGPADTAPPEAGPKYEITTGTLKEKFRRRKEPQ